MTSRDVDATSLFTDKTAIVTSIPFEIESNPLGFSKSEKRNEMTIDEHSIRIYSVFAWQSSSTSHYD